MTSLLRNLVLFTLAGLIPASVVASCCANVDLCPGYRASNVQENHSGLTADLTLAGSACDVYGKDLKNLKVQVIYESKSRIHVKIADREEKRYQVPEAVFPRPKSEAPGSATLSDIVFSYEASPFSFSITRRSSGEKLFDSTGTALVFETQYLRLKTALPANPNIYGLGEHTDSFRLPNVNYTRTLWSRDSYGVPQNSNLYGNHPVYFDHRTSGTHGVFLLNSNGMDIKLTTVDGKSSLEYNVIGGVLDLYFFAGPDPVAVAQQYSEVAGLPAMMPYWAFGFHQCRYGYRDWIDVAEVIGNYSLAKIPLETMWTDIDYMYNRWIFTLDPERFPLEKVRWIVDSLHRNNQKYIVMVDPAVAYQDYPTFNRGVEAGIWLKESNGSIHKGVVWPGVTAFPDWFHPSVGAYWNNEFAQFFSAESGVDIDAVWIDMNEPANFCNYPCNNPELSAIEQHMPPQRLPVREAPTTIPGFPYAVPTMRKRQGDGPIDVISPPYSIANDAPLGLSDRTVHTDIVHYGGYIEYDTHNLYGTMMSDATYDAMLSRRPGLRPLIITRSTFAGAGKRVGKWLGDNLSNWEQYRWSIAGMLGFASIYQMPMVGSDVCGFGDNTTEVLCARWASLGAFYPFYRNHNSDLSIPQEFYRWPLSASSARKSIALRYRLLDYIYTAFHQQHETGAPLLNPLFFKYPGDVNTFAIDTQFFYGDAILVSPVLEENSTAVQAYLPKDIFYEFHTGRMLRGQGHNVTLESIAFDDIPLHIRGGSIIPMRTGDGADTTTELRRQPFTLVVAPDEQGEAAGRLYIDDGVSIEQTRGVVDVTMAYKRGKLRVWGKFGYPGEGQGLKVVAVTVLGVEQNMSECKTVHLEVDVDLVADFDIDVFG